jgi:hypothetical protein
MAKDGLSTSLPSVSAGQSYGIVKERIDCQGGSGVKDQSYIECTVAEPVTDKQCFCD